jgi:hypothetical protein
VINHAQWPPIPVMCPVCRPVMCQCFSPVLARSADPPEAEELQVLVPVHSLSTGPSAALHKLFPALPSVHQAGSRSSVPQMKHSASPVCLPALIPAPRLVLALACQVQLPVSAHCPSTVL